MIEAASCAAAKHGSTSLVDALVELGRADVSLLIVIVCCACDDLSIRRADRATTMTSVRLDANWATRRLRARRQLSLSA